jgi:hypothetical protein
MKVNRTLLFQQSLDPFSRHNKDNLPGSVFCVVCNRQIKYKINNTVHYVKVETFLIYTYILSDKIYVYIRKVSTFT